MRTQKHRRNEEEENKERGEIGRSNRFQARLETRNASFCDVICLFFVIELITKKLDDSALDNELRICCSPIATKFNEDSIRSLKQGQSVNIRDLCRTEAKVR